jgi:hypothetical protein
MGAELFDISELEEAITAVSGHEDQNTAILVALKEL